MKKSLGMPPPLVKKSFGDSAKMGVKKNFPAAPLTTKGPMSKSSDENFGDDASDVSVPKSLPVKGGISKGEKQSSLPGKGMPFMKNAPLSFPPLLSLFLPHNNHYYLIPVGLVLGCIGGI